jgi:hypothetical protein
MRISCVFSGNLVGGHEISRDAFRASAAFILVGTERFLGADNRANDASCEDE